MKLTDKEKIKVRKMTLTDKKKIEKIVDRINFWKHKEVTAEDFSIFFKEIKEIIES